MYTTEKYFVYFEQILSDWSFQFPVFFSVLKSNVSWSFDSMYYEYFLDFWGFLCLFRKQGLTTLSVGNWLCSPDRPWGQIHLPLPPEGCSQRYVSALLSLSVLLKHDFPHPQVFDYSQFKTVSPLMIIIFPFSILSIFTNNTFLIKSIDTLIAWDKFLDVNLDVVSEQLLS